MNNELALRLYNSAERAVKSQFPNLDYFKRAELIIEELNHRFGEDMADLILDTVYEIEVQ